MTTDYIIACLVLALGTLLVLINALRNQKSNPSNNDGGLPIEFDFPKLDLPPGVTLPVGGPKIKECDEVYTH